MKVGIPKYFINNWKIKSLVILLIGLFSICLLHGVLPFLMLPTLGQAIWTTGFAESIAKNISLFDFYAHNFGLPEPAAVQFGLSGVLIVILFIKLGLHPSDAYSSMVVFWLIVSYLSAYRIARFFGAITSYSIVGAILWLSMPVIWGHAGYSMVSLGFALLPFYFIAALHLFMKKNNQTSRKMKHSMQYIFTCFVAVFMDGYSFVMFAIGASIIGLWIFVNIPNKRLQLLYHAFPIHALGFGMGYICYALYIGKTQFASEPIDFFRGWGVDLLFLLIPSQGMHWIPDILGWSVTRSEKEFFGDNSVWTTTFSFPLIIISVWSWWKVRHMHMLATGMLLIVVFGFYMALGPSLKINSVKPMDIKEQQLKLMSAEYAIVPTGSEFLSENIPGFKNMRASYRWVALGVFGSWFLLILLLSFGKRKETNFSLAGIALIVLLNLPNLPKYWEKALNNREMFLQIDSDLLETMQQDLYPNEKVAFLPYRNDFLINYLAARLNIKTYNIGGDKNLFEATENWPETMIQFRMGEIGYGFFERVLLLLARNEADTVVLPYIDMLLSAHRWPYPIQFKEKLSPIVFKLKESGLIDIIERKYYAIVKLNKDSDLMRQDGLLEGHILKTACLPPICLKQQSFTESKFSQVGKIKNAELVSDGRIGFLIFGPYEPMKAGSYSLVVRGKGNLTETAWVDVVSKEKEGLVEHAKFSLLSSIYNNEGFLFKGNVTLNSSVEYIEVRIFVGERDIIHLNSYELILQK